MSTTKAEIKKIDYTNNYEDNLQWPTMHIIARTEDNQRVHITNEDIRPYFYIPEEEFDSELKNEGKVTGTETGFESIQGENLIRIYTRIPGDVPDLREDYNHYEADILFPNRFLIDTDIRNGIEIPSEHATDEPTEISLDDIKNTDINTETHIMFCDIEVDDEHGFSDISEGNEEIVCLSIYDNFTEEYHAWLYHPENPAISHENSNIYVFTSENKMLNAFCKFLKKHKPDVLTGWNFKDFDARYLVNRLDTLDELESNDISPLGSAYDDGWFGGKIKGIAVFDMLRAYQNLQFTDLDSYRLEDVSQSVLGEGKIQDPRSIHEQWVEDPQQLIDYNIKDVELTVLLEEAEDIIKFYEEVKGFVGGRLTETIDYSDAVDQYILRKLHGEFVLPSKKLITSDEEEKFEGAQVFEASSGVKEMVEVLDLASLYPMSMKTLNAGPTTIDDDGDIEAPNGVCFTTEKEAFISEIIDELLEEREEKKSQRDQYDPSDKRYKVYDRQQTAVKVIMNTLYGVAGWEKFRLYDKRVASAVTAVGREVILYTKEVVDEKGYDVIYGDTDSIMVHLGSDYSINQAINIGFNLEEIINDTYDEFAEKELNVDEHFFEIEFEKLYRRYLQSSKKKRYAGHIIWKEGKIIDDIDITGFEFRRSDYGKIPRELQKNILEKIVTGCEPTEISKLIKETIDKIKENEYTLDELGVPGSITRKFEDYESKTIHVKGSEYANEYFNEQIKEGDKPKGLYVKRIRANDNGELDFPFPDMKTPFICWLNPERVPEEFIFDWDKYIDVQIKKPMSRILDGTDWTWGEIISQSKQSSLADIKSLNGTTVMFENEILASSTNDENNIKTKEVEDIKVPSSWKTEKDKSNDIMIDDEILDDKNDNKNRKRSRRSLTDY